METIKVSGILCEKISKKGTTYTAVDVNLTPTYVKTFFLEPADLEVIKMWLENEHLKNERISKLQDEQ